MAIFLKFSKCPDASPGQFFLEPEKIELSVFRFPFLLLFSEISFFLNIIIIIVVFCFFEDLILFFLFSFSFLFFASAYRIFQGSFFPFFYFCLNFFFPPRLLLLNFSSSDEYLLPFLCFNNRTYVSFSFVLLLFYILIHF